MTNKWKCWDTRPVDGLRFRKYKCLVTKDQKRTIEFEILEGEASDLKIQAIVKIYADIESLDCTNRALVYKLIRALRKGQEGK